MRAAIKKETRPNNRGLHDPLNKEIMQRRMKVGKKNALQLTKESRFYS